MTLIPFGRYVGAVVRGKLIVRTEWDEQWRRYGSKHYKFSTARLVGTFTLKDAQILQRLLSPPLLGEGYEITGIRKGISARVGCTRVTKDEVDAVVAALSSRVVRRKKR